MSGPDSGDAKSPGERYMERVYCGSDLAVEPVVATTYRLVCPVHGVVSHSLSYKEANDHTRCLMPKRQDPASDTQEATVGGQDVVGHKPADWLAEVADRATQRLRSQPPQLRSPATRMLIGPDQVDCVPCGGTGKRVVYREGDPFKPEDPEPVPDTHSAAYVQALEAECAKANTLVDLLRLAVREHTMSDETFAPYLQYRAARDLRFQAELTEHRTARERP